MTDYEQILLDEVNRNRRLVSRARELCDGVKSDSPEGIAFGNLLAVREESLARAEFELVDEQVRGIEDSIEMVREIHPEGHPDIAMLESSLMKMKTRRNAYLSK